MFPIGALPPSDVNAAYPTYDGQGHVTNNYPNLPGVTIQSLLAQPGLDVAAQSVGSVEVVGTEGGSCDLHMSSTFEDFVNPSSDAFPFQDSYPPALGPAFAGLVFVVPIRKPGRGDATVSDGEACQTTSTNSMEIQAHLTTSLLVPSVVATPTELTAPGAVQLTATVVDSDPRDQLTWTWQFDATHTQTVETGAGRTSTLRHTFASGTWYPSVTVSGSNGSAGATSSQVRIHVAGPTPTNPPTSPSPGPSLGTGGPSAPQQGPQTGTGPLVAGATGTGGRGQAGPSGVAGSATPTSSASGTAAPTSGEIVGYLLSDGTAAAQPKSQTGLQPRDDTAMAARNGVESTRIAGWLIAAAVVAGLLLLGVGSERRRPPRATPRRRGR